MRTCRLPDPPVGKLRTITAGLAAAAILGGLIAAGAWVAPRLDVPARFWTSPMGGRGVILHPNQPESGLAGGLDQTACASSPVGKSPNPPLGAFSHR